MRHKRGSVAILAALSGFFFASVLWADKKTREEWNKDCENNLGNYVDECFKKHPTWTGADCAQYAGQHVQACKDNFERGVGKPPKVPRDRPAGVSTTVAQPTITPGKGMRVRGSTDTTVNATTTSTASPTPTPKLKPRSSPDSEKKD